MSLIRVPVIKDFSSEETNEIPIGNVILIEKNVVSLIHPSWYDFFINRGLTFNARMMAIFKQAYKAGYRIIPECDEIYKPFSMSLDSVKAVIVGQDPYPGWDKEGNRNVACGLSFATEAKETPCSLQRIREAISAKFGKISITDKNHPNNLKGWIDQGVLLLNNTPVLAVQSSSVDDTSSASSTTTKSIPSPEKIWQGLTIEICREIARVNPSCQFILMGAKAQLIQQSIAKCIPTNHPSTRSSLEFDGSCFAKVPCIDWTRF